VRKHRNATTTHPPRNQIKSIAVTSSMRQGKRGRRNLETLKL
jgi:hypothetical protein